GVATAPSVLPSPHLRTAATWSPAGAEAAATNHSTQAAVRAVSAGLPERSRSEPTATTKVGLGGEPAGWVSTCRLELEATAKAGGVAPKAWETAPRRVSRERM